VSEIGFRVYALGYTQLLFQRKAMELGLPWTLLKNKLLGITEALYKNGIFITHVLDDDNYAACCGSHLMNRDLDVSIAVKLVEAALVVTADPTAAVRMLCPKTVRGYMEQLLPGQGVPWRAVESVVEKLIDKFAGERLVCVSMTESNADEMRKALELLDNQDLPIRIRPKEVPSGHVPHAP
jgi:hypothetical protein